MLKSTYIQREVYMYQTNLAFKNENEFSIIPELEIFCI